MKLLENLLQMGWKKKNESYRIYIETTFVVNP